MSVAPGSGAEDKKETELSKEILEEKFIKQGSELCVVPQIRNAAENPRIRNETGFQ